MTVRELKEIVNNIDDENMEIVVAHIRSYDVDKVCEIGIDEHFVNSRWEQNLVFTVK